VRCSRVGCAEVNTDQTFVVRKGDIGRGCTTCTISLVVCNNFNKTLKGKCFRSDSD
jgi:hypothetical protein